MGYVPIIDGYGVIVVDLWGSEQAVSVDFKKRLAKKNDIL